MKDKIAGIALVVFWVFVSCPAAFAQTDTGSISGVVNDLSGAVVPAATVTLTNEATGQVRATSTDASGVYSIPNIPPGTYTLVLEKAGFTANRTSNIHVGLQQAVGQNVVLQVGANVSSVTVSAVEAQLQTQSASIGDLRDPEQLVQLPSNGRSVLSVAVLAPTMAAGSIAISNPGDSSFYGTVSNQVSVAGAGDTGTLFLQDGVENINLITITMNIVPSIESIEEVNTTMNGADARYAQPSVINIITKGGSNSFHGTAYDFLQNDALRARDFFQAATAAKPVVRYNLFGANLGGAIVKNKIFGFFDYTGLRSSVGGPSRAIVPTAQERAGDFSADATIYDPTTFNPLTGTIQPFPGNKIPTASINPFAVLWMQLYPQANAIPNSGSPYNYFQNISTTSNQDEYLARGDWNISSKDRLYGSALHLNAPNLTPTIITGLFGQAHINVGTNAAVEETHVFNSHTVNTARVGYNRTNYFYNEQGSGLKNYAQYYGLTNVSALASQSAPPTISISNISSYGSPYTPQGAISNRFQFADELNIIFGKHMLYVGGEVVRTRYYGEWTINNNAQYAFDGTMTALYSLDPASGKIMESTTSKGNGLADLLLGYPHSESHSIGAVADHFFDTNIAEYIQDTWKVTPKLTLSGGVRYEIFTPPTSPNSTSFNFVTQQNQRGSWPTNYGDIGPRFGFSYNVFSRWVVRGGYGIYFAENPYNNEQFMLTYPPQYVSQGYVQTINNPTRIQDVFLPAPPPGERGYTNNPSQMKDTSVQEWNLTIEHQVSNNTMLTLAYIGDVIRHQTVRYDGDMPYLATPGSPIFNVWPIPSLGSSIMTQSDIVNGSYNAAVLSINRHFRNGIQFRGDYTWSRAFGISTGDNDVVETIYHLRYQYGPTAFDQPQVLHLDGVYALPLGQGKRFLSSGAWYNRVLGDWMVSGIWTLAKAPPSAVSAVNNVSASTVMTMYANKVCDPYSGSFTQTLGDWFNKSCFVQPPNGQYGIGGHNGIYGPHINNFDLAFSKVVRIKESSQVQIRADFFNAFNHPQFILGGQSVTSSAYGAIGSDRGMRNIQLSARFSF